MKNENGLSVVVLTCNRTTRCRKTLQNTARALHGLPAEILLLNNGSEPLAMPDQIGTISLRVLQMPGNLGAEARNQAIEHAHYENLFFMDDDVYIEPLHANRLLDCLRAHPETGCVAFRIRNATTTEASLLPTVFHGCAVGMRARALAHAGGYPKGYGYYAEEYHVTFRIRQEGFTLRLLENTPPILHARDPEGRHKDRILKNLVRNNVRLLTTFMPGPHYAGALRDIWQRYRLVARKERAMQGFLQGRRASLWAFARGLLERRPLERPLFRAVALLPQLEQALQWACEHRTRSIILGGTGRFPRLWLRAVRQHGLLPHAFLDTNTCWTGQQIDGVPVVATPDELPPDPEKNPCVILGLSSMAETDAWRQTLPDYKMQLVKEAVSARETEHFAQTDTPLLDNCCRLLIYRPC